MHIQKKLKGIHFATKGAGGNSSESTMKKSFTAWLFIFFLLVSGRIFSAPQLEITSDRTPYDIIPVSQYYCDTTSSLDIIEIQEIARSGKFKKTEQSPLQLGYTRNTIWLTFTIKNNILDNKLVLPHWYLELLNPSISYIDVYFVETSGKYSHLYSSGMSRDPGDQVFHTSFFTDISNYILQEGSFYIKLNSIYSQVISARIITDQKFSTEESKNRILPGIITGMLFSLFLYNLFLFYSLKDITYFFYAGYMFFGIITFSPNVGYLKIFFGSQVKLMIVFSNITLAIWGMFHMLFIKKFLNVAQLQPVMNRILNIILLLWLGFGALNFWIEPDFFYQSIEIIGLCGLVVSIYIGIRSYLNGYLPARFFLAGYLIFFTVFTVYLLMMINVVPVENFALFLLMPGFAHAGEATMLSFALADRYRVLEKESRSLLEIQKEMQLAAEVQKHLFPGKIPEHQNYHIYGNYIPSSEMCGDFYDIIEDHESESTSVLIADVAGHGYSASLISAMVKIAFRESYHRHGSSSEQLSKMNDILSGIVSDTFITASIIKIDYRNMTAQYSQAGHMPLVLHRRSENTIESIKPAGIPLGISNTGIWEKIDYSLKKLDRLFLFTDGLIDCLDSTGKEFGMDRLLSEIQHGADLSASQFSEYLIGQLKKWDRRKLVNQDDDITFVVADIF